MVIDWIVIIRPISKAALGLLFILCPILSFAGELVPISESFDLCLVNPDGGISVELYNPVDAETSNISYRGVVIAQISMSIYQGTSFPGADHMDPIMRDRWANGDILDMGKSGNKYLMMTRNFREHTYPDVFVIIEFSRNFPKFMNVPGFISSLRRCSLKAEVHAGSASVISN